MTGEAWEGRASDEVIVDVARKVRWWWCFSNYCSRMAVNSTVGVMGVKQIQFGS